jgi:hypothetical protein
LKNLPRKGQNKMQEKGRAEGSMDPENTRVIKKKPRPLLGDTGERP